MINAKIDKDIHKQQVLESVHRSTPAIKKYQEFFVGSDRLIDLVRYEIIVGLMGWLPGALGLLLRKTLYPSVLRKVGSSVVWGRNITLRHPSRISIGDRVAIDDYCLLDAKDGDIQGIQIGSDVLIGRYTIIRTKGAGIRIGSHCSISSQCLISSVSGLSIGDNVMIAANSLIGGARYHTEDVNTPIREQGIYTKGPIIIEDDVWLGAGVIVQDGVHIGRGSVIGAGALIREDVPENTVVVPQQRLAMLPRNKE